MLEWDQLALVAVLIGLAALWWWRTASRDSAIKERRQQQRLASGLDAEQFAITSVEQLRALIPVGQSGSCPADAPKVLDALDEHMCQFVKQSPFVQLATADANGLPYCSPKGDSPGFVRIVDDTTLLIPDRPGNRLLFGLQNILINPRVGLCFLIPGNSFTLRVGGRASLSKDPKILKLLAARRIDATLAIRVHIEYAFFHCAKALTRSKLWKLDTWPVPEDRLKVTFGRYFSKVPAVQALVNRKVDQIETTCRKARTVCVLRKYSESTVHRCWNWR